MYLGDHDIFAGSYPLCNNDCKPNNKKAVPEMKKWGSLEEVENAISRIAIHAEGSLMNFESNKVESTKSIVA